jgi:hypothetical protein
MSSEQFNHEVDVETLALEDNMLLKMCWRRWRKRWWSRTDLEDNVSLLSSYLERASKGAIERRKTAVIESAEAEQRGDRTCRTDSRCPTGQGVGQGIGQLGHVLGHDAGQVI